MSDNTHSTEVGGIGLVTVILALIFLFVWPGPLRWQYSSGTPRAKIDRISGKTFVLTGEGWRKLATDVRQEMPIGEYSDLKLTSPALPIGKPTFSLRVYNPTGWALTELAITARWGHYPRRCYLKPEATIEPGASGTVSTTVPNELVIPSVDNKRDFEWSLAGAKGYPAD